MKSTFLNTHTKYSGHGVIDYEVGGSRYSIALINRWAWERGDAFWLEACRFQGSAAIPDAFSFTCGLESKLFKELHLSQAVSAILTNCSMH